MIDMDKLYQIDDISKQIENSQQKCLFEMACYSLDFFKKMNLDKSINQITYEDLFEEFLKMIKRYEI